MVGNSAPGPYGFGGCFFQSYWDVVGINVIKSVNQFFEEGWIIPNLNPINIILIVKQHGTNYIE